MFYRLHTDQTPSPAALDDAFAGPLRTPCWLVGGGPSLARLPCADIAASPLPKFCVNLCGHGLLRPDLWTSYDPTARFHRSVYLDPSIVKFLHRRRAMDLVPGTTFKVCECPQTYFFDRDTRRGFHDFPGPSRAREPGTGLPPSGAPQGRPIGITDWQDSFIQAIDIAFRLGFRILYLAGCDMQIRPSPEQLARAREAGVDFVPGELLKDFLARCEASGLSRHTLESLAPPQEYHFDEQKPLAAAAQTDLHYFRIVQYLRLSRRALALAGLELISVTPDSRLNDHFDYRPIEDVLASIAGIIGDPAAEQTRGRYGSDQVRTPPACGPMRDLRPHHWENPATKPAAAAPVAPHEPEPPVPDPRARLRAELDNLPEIPVPIDENG